MQQRRTGTGGACAPLSEILPPARVARFVGMTEEMPRLPSSGFFLVSFRAAAAKNPGRPFYDAALTRFRSADPALNDTAIAVSLPQSAPRIGFGYERKVIASSGMHRNLQKSLFSRKGGRFRDFEVSYVAEREKN